MFSWLFFMFIFLFFFILCFIYYKFSRLTGGSTKTETDGADHVLLLVGKTGSGKSSTGNTILGKKVFDDLPSADSVTSECQIKETVRNGGRIQVMDSPGLFDTGKNELEVVETVVKTVAGMYPGPDAFLYTISLAGRFTNEDVAAYQRLKAVFDDKVCRYMLIVFTHGDALEKRNISINDYIRSVKSPELLQVLKDCNGRYVVVNNEAKDPTPQVQHLLQMVKSLKAENNGKPYCCPKYAAIEGKIKEEVDTRLAGVEKRELETTRTVQELKQKTQNAKEDKKKAEEDKKKSVEEKKKAEEEKKKAEEDKKKAEEDKKTAEEEKKKAEEEKKKAEEEKKKAEEEKKTAEEDKKKAEEDKTKAEEEKKKIVDLAKVGAVAAVGVAAATAVGGIGLGAAGTLLLNNPVAPTAFEMVTQAVTNNLESLAIAGQAVGTLIVTMLKRG